MWYFEIVCAQKRYLENEAISKRITKESFEKFQSRVLRAFDSIPITLFFFYKNV